MKIRHLILSIAACGALIVPAFGQLTQAQIQKPSPDSWPTYHGDYYGRHYSPLTQINQTNVKHLSLAWVARMSANTLGAIVGGEGPEPKAGAPAGGVSVKSIPLMVNGVLYFSTPDHAWAVDARTGKEIWHYFWKTQGGLHIGNRGMGMYGNWLYFETPDDYIISLDAKTGRERWHKKIADVKAEYFSTMAPLVIGNHVIVGMGGDFLDVPGWLESRDPETGEIQWKWFTTPRPGEPGAETWPDAFSMEHGGGMPWQPPTYDPELNLLYVPTGNANPVFIGDSRKGDNLYTSSIVALNPDTGKMKWYFQGSPHDTHDWDATEVPILFDGVIPGETKTRKLLAQAHRNGMFFLLDRETGKNLLSTQFSDVANWSLGFKPNGQPIPNPMKEPQRAGALVSPGSNGATNWPAPSFSPDSGLFYMHSSRNYAMFYRTDTPGEAIAAYGGSSEHRVDGFGGSLQAIDYKTGKTKWIHDYPGGAGGAGGLLSTAGKLLFAGDGAQNIVAHDPATGKILWHAGLTAGVSNAPETFMLDGHQYLLVGAGDSLYAFYLQ